MFFHTNRLKFRLIFAGLCLAATVVFLTQTSTATPSIGTNTAEFATTTLTLSGATNTHKVITADFDGDGAEDIFFARNGSNQVLLNGGGGSVLANTADTRGAAVGDVDNDGDLDIFTANNGSEDQVWLNNGAGTFTNSGQNLGGTGQKTAVVLGDIDNDGDLDGISVSGLGTSGQTGFTQIYTNDGNGNFSTGFNFFFAPNTRDVRLADADGDGDLDAFFAYANATAANGLLLNNGSGSFTNAPTPLNISHANGLALGDVDKDGDIDVFVATVAGQPNQLWLNNGAGVFTAGQTLGTVGTAEAALGDVDNDGDFDLYLANEGTAANEIWLNDGNGTFTANGQSFGSDNSRSVALFHLDSDGDLDAVVGNLGTADYARANSLPGRNAPLIDDGVPIGSVNTETHDIRTGDLDNDGDVDLLTVKPGSNWIWLNDGNGNFSSSGQSFGNVSAYGADLGDVDNDGDLDLFFAPDSSGEEVWFNDGAGNFTDSGQVLGNYTSAPGKKVRLGDFDNDGDLDAVVGDTNTSAAGGNSRIWLNNGNGIFTAGQVMSSNNGVGGIAIGDVNGDGALDIFTSRLFAGHRVFLNDGNAGFTSAGIFGGQLGYDVDLGDVDGDGDLDALMGSNFNSTAVVWLNDSNGVFTDSGVGYGGSNHRNEGVLLRDLDNDGDLDMYIANSLGFNVTVQPDFVYYNDGGGTFSVSETYNGQNQTYAVAADDFDGDGDIDIVVGNVPRSVSTSIGNRLLRNTGGTAELIATDAYSGGSYVPYGDEAAALEISFAHRGRASDVDIELAEMRLTLYDTGCTIPLTTAQASDRIASLNVRLDDGDNSFTPATDTLVASVSSFSLTAGEQFISFVDGDANVQVSGGNQKRYWVSLVAPASGSGTQDVCVQYDADAQTLVEGKTPDFGVSVADTAVVQTSNVPLTITLSEMGVAQRQGLHVWLATAVLLLVTVSIVFIQRQRRA